MISLAAVEVVAGKVWPNQLSAVVAVADARKGERLVLLTDAEGAARDDFVRFAKANGGQDLMIPAVVKVGEVPVLGSGKIDFVGVKKQVESEIKEMAYKLRRMLLIVIKIKIIPDDVIDIVIAFKSHVGGTRCVHGTGPTADQPGNFAITLPAYQRSIATCAFQGCDHLIDRDTEAGQIEDARSFIPCASWCVMGMDEVFNYCWRRLDP